MNIAYVHKCNIYDIAYVAYVLSIIIYNPVERHYFKYVPVRIAVESARQLRLRGTAAVGVHTYPAGVYACADTAVSLLIKKTVPSAPPACRFPYKSFSVFGAM
jgi:hypothetical protein